MRNTDAKERPDGDALTLRNYRRALGLKQQEMADELRVSKSILTKWENNLAPVPKWVEPTMRRMFHSVVLDDLTPEEIGRLNDRARAAGKSFDRYVIDIIKSTLSLLAGLWAWASTSSLF